MRIDLKVLIELDIKPVWRSNPLPKPNTMLNRP